MKAIVQFSGGVGSWAAARRAVETYDEVTLLFADTLIEDADLYRFLNEAADNIGAPLVKIADGRTPWEVFRDVRFIGNTRADPCSLVLKRDLLRAWIEEHADPSDTAVVLGIDWSESHRLASAIPRWEPWTLVAPMCDPPYLDKNQVLAQLRDEGIKPPRLYAMGFPHNNCGGFCVKAGQAQFKLLLDKMPERYLGHEREEEATRAHIGKDVAVLRDRSAKGIAEYEAVHGPDSLADQATKTVPLTLRRFRERLGVDATDFDAEEWGGCGCAID